MNTANMSTESDRRDPEQTWFWSADWQTRHREAMDDVSAGRVKTYDTIEAMLADLADDNHANADPASSHTTDG